jgi:hypothetical protein
MAQRRIPRRSLIGSAFALPLGFAGQPQHTPTPNRAVARVAAGEGRFNEVLRLPGGDLLYVKVATGDTGGALFMTEQPIERRDRVHRSTITRTKMSGGTCSPEST